MKENRQRHSISGLFTLILLLMFAFSTLSLVLLGSRIYRNGISFLNRNYTTRTAVAYVTEKIRQHDEEDCVFLSELDGIPALLLKDEIDGDTFFTYIYFYDGALRELFMRSSSDPSPDMGSRIVVLDDFSVTASPELQDTLLIRAAGGEGHSLEASVYVAAGLSSFA